MGSHRGKFGTRFRYGRSNVSWKLLLGFQRSAPSVLGQLSVLTHDLPNLQVIAFAIDSVPSRRNVSAADF